jgi:hypothetical protein
MFQDFNTGFPRAVILFIFLLLLFSDESVLVHLSQVRISCQSYNDVGFHEQ